MISQMKTNPEVARAADILAKRLHRYEPWRRMVLVPLWFLQMSIALASTIWALYNANHNGL